MSLLRKFYPEVSAGGFTRFDGTIQFYFRVNSLLQPHMTVLDLGAGRGAVGDSPVSAIKYLYDLRDKSAEVIGVDIDPAVLGNPFVNRAIVYDGSTIPLGDSSIDLVVCDYTFEHVEDPETFVREISRVLRVGGWVCARTPHVFSILAFFAQVIPNRRHVRLLSAVQPDRKAEDVFPTVYKMNRMGRLRALFPSSGWRNCSFTYSSEPAYHFNSRLVFRALQIYQYLKAPFLGGETLLVFMQKNA
jgi:ubiquinone/menaquinone biosynthesis C-methylase UbiE